jgi:hypothetical protein
MDSPDVVAIVRAQIDASHILRHSREEIAHAKSHVWRSQLACARARTLLMLWHPDRSTSFPSFLVPSRLWTHLPLSAPQTVRSRRERAPMAQFGSS